MYSDRVVVLRDGDALADLDVHRGDVLVQAGHEFGELGDLNHEGGLLLLGRDRLHALRHLASIQRFKRTM